MRLDTYNTEDWIKGPIEEPEEPIEKMTSRRRRQSQLVARLKARRNYAAPVRGGTGKQRRTRRKKFG